MTRLLNHTIPLRRDFIKVPKYRRAKRAVNFIKKYVKRHSKQENIKIGSELNQHIWENGIRNPPGKVKVEILVDEDVAIVNLPGLLQPKEETKAEDKKESKKEKEDSKDSTKATKTEKVEEKTTSKKEEKEDDLKKPNSNNTKKEMMEYLDQKDVDYKTSMLKDEIYELVKKN